MPRYLLAMLVLLVSNLGQADTTPIMLTGEVYSMRAQEIIVPLTPNMNSKISKMLPEGSFVEAGDVVVEFEGTEAARQLEQQEEAARTDLARTERDLARLEKELAQASYGHEQARVQLELARLKAEIPEGLIGAIEHSENQLAFEEAINEQENTEEQLEDKQKSFAERREQAEMDNMKLKTQQKWWGEMLESFTIYANQSGYVMYGIHPWTRTKFQEGDNVQTSFKIAQVADTADLAIKVWINGVDKPHISQGDRVEVRMDALADRIYTGKIEAVSDSGSKRQEWGKADYFEAIVRLDQDISNELLPGMSALVELVQ